MLLDDVVASLWRGQSVSRWGEFSRTDDNTHDISVTESSLLDPGAFSTSQSDIEQILREKGLPQQRDSSG